MADSPFTADGGLACDAFVEKHAETIGQHYARTGGIFMETADASRMAQGLWEYIEYLRSWSEQIFGRSLPRKRPRRTAPAPDRTQHEGEPATIARRRRLDLPAGIAHPSESLGFGA
ncbi:hypothetical protein [Thiocystis violascens]|nr:hypothetical protein [Thiocystis violascens]